MELYIELDEGVRYNRSTGVIIHEDKRKRDIELTKTEMEIMEILLDGKRHKISEFDKEETNIRMIMSRIRKKIGKYFEIYNIYEKGEYKCERIKSEKERQ